MSYNFTVEQLEAAKRLKSPEELVAMAKEQGFDVTSAQAAAFLDTQTMELADEELDNVAGGGCDDTQGWKEKARMDNRLVELGFNWKADRCWQCKKYASVFARHKDECAAKDANGESILKVDYYDCKCYACNRCWTVLHFEY